MFRPRISFGTAVVAAFSALFSARIAESNQRHAKIGPGKRTWWTNHKPVMRGSKSDRPEYRKPNMVGRQAVVAHETTLLDDLLAIPEFLRRPIKAAPSPAVHVE